MSEEEWEAQNSSQAEMVIGQDLSAFSIAELESLLTLLNKEIERVNETISKKQSQASQAEGLFKSDTKEWFQLLKNETKAYQTGAVNKALR